MGSLNLRLSQEKKKKALLLSVISLQGERSVSVSESNSQKNNGELGDVSEVP